MQQCHKQKPQHIGYIPKKGLRIELNEMSPRQWPLELLVGFEPIELNLV